MNWLLWLGLTTCWPLGQSFPVSLLNSTPWGVPLVVKTSAYCCPASTVAALARSKFAVTIVTSGGKSSAFIVVEASTVSVVRPKASTVLISKMMSPESAESLSIVTWALVSLPEFMAVNVCPSVWDEVTTPLN